MNFDLAIEYVLDEEGGFQKNKKDSGNWTGGKIDKGELKGTKYGISAASYKDLDIENLTRKEAIAIYRRDFWDQVFAEYLPAKVRLHVFDFGVNAGPEKARKMVQRVLGVKQDGEFGPVTMARISLISPFQFQRARTEYYFDLVKAKPEKREFLEGWIIRNESITEICVNHI